VKRLFWTAPVLTLFTIALISPSAARAQTCSGTQDFAGAFAFIATRLLWEPVSATSPGTTGAPFTPVAVTPPGTTDQFSLSAVAQLAKAAAGSSPFSVVGRVLADGGGNLFLLPGFLKVGSYTVNSDCTVALTIRDFSLDAAPGTPGTQASPPLRADFEGVLQERGEAVRFVQVNQGVGAHLEMMRPFMNSGCSNATISGAYGLGAFGVQFTGSASAGSDRAVMPFSLVGRVVADGAGNFVLDSGASNSPLTSRQFTGKYSVKDDCTGTASVVSSDGKTTRLLSIALVTPADPSRPGVSVVRPVIGFIFEDDNLAGAGSGR